MDPWAHYRIWRKVSAAPAKRGFCGEFMNMEKAIADLRFQLEAVDQVISTFERLAAIREPRRGRPPKWRKGTKSGLSKLPARKDKQPAGGYDPILAAKRYWVYANGSNDHAVGHFEPCASIKVWGARPTAAQGWLGPFESRSQAESAGQASAKPFRWCQRCSAGH
jgi:hypothetical protein